MIERIKQLFPFIYIPFLIILLANLFGFAFRFLIPFLNQNSNILQSLLNRLPHSYRSSLAFLLTIIGLIILFSYLTRFIKSFFPIDPAEYLRKHILYDNTSNIVEFEPSEPRSLITITKPESILDIVMLVLLFLFKVILAILICVLSVLLLIGIYKLIIFIFSTSFFKKYNLFFFQLSVLSISQAALRKETLRFMSWKKLGDLWMKIPKISTITVGGFGIIAVSDAIKNPLIQLALHSEYTNLRLIIPTTLFGVLLMILAMIIEKIGRTKSPNDDGNIPRGWFYTAFGMAFLVNVAMFGLLLNSIFLTIYSHYLI